MATSTSANKNSKHINANFRPNPPRVKCSGNDWVCFGVTTFIGGIVGIVFFIIFLVEIGGDGGGGGSNAYYRGGSGGSSSSSGRGGCFPAGEMIQLETNEEVPVQDLRPGSFAKEGGLITAVFKLLPAEQEILYFYNNSVWVTGTHSVFEGDLEVNTEDDREGHALTLVKDSVLANIVPTDHFWDTSRDYLYNIVADEHRIVINGTLFSDWEERDFCSKYLLQQLNDPDKTMDPNECSPNELDEDPSDPIDEGSFVAGTMISVDSSKSVPIERLEPGDIIEGGTVLAVVRIFQQSGGFVYRHHSVSSDENENSNDYIEATKWTIVKDEDGQWRYIQDSCDAVHHRVIGEEGEIFYQLITSSHHIVAATGSVYSDYEVLDEVAVGSPPVRG